MPHDDFTLTVPEGALAASVSLALYETEADHGFGGNAISPLYRIDGLPETFSESLYVRIRYDGTLSEESHIAFGEFAEQMIAATDSSGFLVTLIPPRTADGAEFTVDLLKRPSAAANEDHFAAIANYKASYQTPLFTINYPAYLIDYIDDIAAYVD